MEDNNKIVVKKAKYGEISYRIPPMTGAPKLTM
jgi:hypothetical protein